MLPEEKLLRLIRSDSKSKNSQRDKRSRINFRKLLTLDFIKAGLKILFSLSIIYLAAGIMYSLAGLKNINLPQTAKVRPGEVLGSSVNKEGKPLDFYTTALKDTKAFTSAVKNPSGQPYAVSGEALKDIGLVGIISGDPAQAVIEDKKVQKTYYITKGQSVGDFQLEDIQDGKIILSCGGQKYELYI